MLASFEVQAEFTSAPSLPPVWLTQIPSCALFLLLQVSISSPVFMGGFRVGDVSLILSCFSSVFHT